MNVILIDFSVGGEGGGGGGGGGGGEGGRGLWGRGEGVRVYVRVNRGNIVDKSVTNVSTLD